MAANWLHWLGPQYFLRCCYRGCYYFLKKPPNKPPYFLLLFSLSTCPSNFFLLASKQFLIKFTMYYIGVSFENLTFKVLKHCHVLGVCHFLCQICLKLSSSWNFNLKWMSIFSRLRKTCCFYLKLIHNSSSEMLFFSFSLHFGAWVRADQPRFLSAFCSSWQVADMPNLQAL